MNDLTTLGSAGFTMPGPAYFIGATIFSSIGFVANRYAKKMSLTRPYWIGWALMLYPCVVTQVWLLYLIGIALCAALYIFRE
jgi:hypothetical protein